MDKYKVEEKIGKGILADIYKVKDNKTSNLYILKEIECLDPQNAQTIFKELKPLQKINNPYICKIHDLFVKWDKTISCAFTCYAMDHYKNGNLKDYLNKLRDNKEKVPLVTVKKTFAMIFEGMFYLFKKDIIHRNLKPASLYIQNPPNQKDFKLQIGDFGVYTAIKDAHIKTRILKGAFNYVAPEIIDAQNYDEKSDIWSIASTLIDMCTTSIYDNKDFTIKLLNMRHSDDVLEEMLVEIMNVYREQHLVDFLRALLDKKNVKRPGYKQILEKNFARECLELIDSELVRFYGFTDAGPSDIDLPCDEAEELLEFIIKNLEYESRVQAALIRICELETININILSDNYQNLVLKLMEDYSNNIQIQSSVLELVRVSLGELFQTLYRDTTNETKNELDLRFLLKFIHTYIKQADSKEIQFAGLKIIIELANFDFEKIKNILLKYNIHKYIIESIKRFESDSLFCAWALKAFWSLTIHESLLKAFRNMDCLKIIRNILVMHKEDSDCVEMACNSIIGLSMDAQIINDEEMEADATSAIVVALKNNYTSTSVSKSACLALLSLITYHEECAFRFLFVPPSADVCEEIEGISLIKTAYNAHKDNSEVVEIICQLFLQLCKYDEMIEEIKSLRLQEKLLFDIRKRFRDHQKISAICNEIFSKIK